MEDFTAFDSAAAHPGPQTNYGSHEEFLKCAVLRHQINNTMHTLSLEQLALALDFMKVISTAHEDGHE